MRSYANTDRLVHEAGVAGEGAHVDALCARTVPDFWPHYFSHGLAIRKGKELYTTWYMRQVPPVRART